MATFRQEQIDEILNYERSLNRKIYDTEILAVTRMNDERNPPSNRDIKFEAILGGLIDKLKQSIAEAVQSIASKQYPTLNAVNSAKLLALKSGIKGVLGAPPNSEQAEQNRLAAEATRQALEDSRKAAQSIGAKSGTSDRGPSISMATNSSGLPDIPAASAAPASASANDESYNEEFHGLGLGKPIRARHQGFGADFLNRKKRKVGGNPNGAPTAQESETAKSEKSMTKTTENLLYSVVGQYNGIVDKLLEATQQNGLYKNKRLASASNVQYYSNVLKGINEPLKHLLFELSQVQQPEVASLFNMIARMVDVIDISPPFQKVDVMAYREGKPDFQGLNDDLVMHDYSGYLTALEKAKSDYVKTIRDFDNAAITQKATLPNIDQKYKQGIFKEIADKQKSAQEVLEKLQAEIMNVKRKMNSPLRSMTDDLNDAILAEVAQKSQEILGVINSNPSEWGIQTFTNLGITEEEAKKMTRLPKELQLAEADILARKIKEYQSSVQKMYRIALEQGGLEDDITGAHRRAYEEGVANLQRSLSNLETLANLPAYRSERAAIMDKKLAREKAKLDAQKAQSEGAPAEGAEGEEGDSSGAMGALAAQRGEGPQADASKEALEVEEEEEDEGAEGDELDEDAEAEPEDAEAAAEAAAEKYKAPTKTKAKELQDIATEKARLSKLKLEQLRDEMTDYNLVTTKKVGKSVIKLNKPELEAVLLDYFKQRLAEGAPVGDDEEDEEEEEEEEEEDDEDEDDDDEDDGEGEWQTVEPKGKVVKSAAAPKGVSKASIDESEIKLREQNIAASSEEVNDIMEEMNDLTIPYFKKNKWVEGAKLEEYNKKADALFNKLKKAVDTNLLSKRIAAMKGDFDDEYAKTSMNKPVNLANKLIDHNYDSKIQPYYSDTMKEIVKITRENVGRKSGKGKPLANLLASPKQQYNSMGRPVSNDDKINNQMIKMNNNWQKHNPRHENPVGSLYPFKAKTGEARYDFPTELRYNRNITNPTRDARGADYSLLQGEIGGPTVNVEAKRQYKPAQRQVVTPAQALQNVLSGAGRHKSGALKKLVFDDEDNDMFGEQEMGRNSGFIPEDKEDRFKFPDLKKKKEKEAAAKLSGRKR